MPIILTYGWWGIFPVFGIAAMLVFRWVMGSQSPRHRHSVSFGPGCGFPRACGTGMSAEFRESVPPTASSHPDPLVIARERYAQGLISPKEFDALVERLVKTEGKPW